MAFIHNHTKGDWEISKEQNYDSDRIMILDSNIDVWNFDISNKEMQHNAKLISQAPKLLEFAEMLHDQYVKQEKKPFWFKDLQSTIERAGVEITHK